VKVISFVGVEIYRHLSDCFVMYFLPLHCIHLPGQREEP